MIKNCSRSEKISSHGNFSHFRFQVKTASERIVQKILKKTNTPLRVVKNQEHRNIATLSLQLRSYKKTEYKIELLCN